jgi:mRNA interferase HigB
MRIVTEKTITDYIKLNPKSETALQDWTKKVKLAHWNNFADIKNDFRTVDNVGNQHYVFNIKGNDYRLIVVIKFKLGLVYIRFIGTHAEYDKIPDCSTI